LNKERRRGHATVSNGAHRAWSRAKTR